MATLETLNIIAEEPVKIEDVMDINKNGMLLRRILGEGYRASMNHIDSFNYMIEVDLPRQIESKVIHFKDNTENIFLRFGPTFILPPTYMHKDKELPLTPALAINLGIDYTFTVSTFFTLVKDGDPNDPCVGKVISQSDRPINIGRIPCMIKSKICHLYKKTPQQISEMGSDFREPGGYFIVGNERVIFFIEKVRVNRIISGLTYIKKYFYVNVTASTNNGTMVTTIINERKKTKGGNINHILSLKLNNIKNVNTQTNSSFNILSALILYVIYKEDFFEGNSDFYKNPYNLERIIMMFIKPERVSKCKSALVDTIFDSFKNINNIEASFQDMVKENRQNYINDKIKKGKTFNEGMSVRDSSIHTLVSSLLSHEDHTEPVNVVYTACMMIAHLLEVIAGYRTITNRNKWMYKREDTAGVVISQLFRGFWKNYTNELSNIKLGKLHLSMELLKNKIPVEKISKDFHTAFVTNFSMNNLKESSEGVTQILQQETFYEKISLLAHSTPKVDRKVKDYDVRAHHADGWGLIDPGDTSENSGVGLNRKLALTAHITVPESPDTIISLILGNIDVDGYAKKRYVNPYVDETSFTTVLVNFKFMGWANGKLLTKLLIKAKRSGVIPRKTSIFHDSNNRELIISTDLGRLTRPLLIVEDNVPVIDKKNGWDKTLNELLELECMEFIDSAEVHKIRIANSQLFLEKWLEDKDYYTSRVIELQSMIVKNPEDKSLVRQLNSAKLELEEIVSNPYTHMEIDPQALLGPTVSNMPFANYNQAPRVSYFSQQGKQAIGIYHTEYAQRFDNDAKVLRRAVKPIAGQQLEDEMMLKLYQHGVMGEIALINMDGQTMEDAIIISERVTENGTTALGHYFVIIAKLTKNEKLTKPKPRHGETEDNYRFLTNDGLPMINAPLSDGDFVLGKVYTDPKKKDVRNTSIEMKIGEHGFVDSVFVSNVGGDTVVKIRLRRNRETQISDKFASRYAQKATISEKYPFHKLPMDLITGQRPSFIVNTHSMPSRMTGGYMLEPILSLAALLLGRRVNAAPFQKNNIDEAYRTLKSFGFDATGYRWMRNPETGLEYRAMIYTGPIFMQILRHLGPEKLQVRARGLVKLINQQPPRKSKVGGRRLGNMEGNALMSHGANNFLLERMVEMSDKYKAPFCVKCGTIAIMPAETGIAYCKYCKTNEVDTTIYKVRIPYIYKLITQSLDASLIRVKLVFDNIKELAKEETPALPNLDEAIEVEDIYDAYPNPDDEELDVVPGDEIFGDSNELYDDAAFDVEFDEDD